MELPESWEELQAKDRLLMFKLLYKKGLTRPKLRLKLVEKMVLPKHRKVVRVMDPLVICEISELLQYSFTEPCPLKIIPGIRHNGTMYYLPDSYLDNAAFIEFMYADAFLEQVANHQGKLQDCKALDKLVAILCRPGKWFWSFRKYGATADGDRRQRFNSSTLAYRAKKFRNMPMPYKMYVLNYFIACKQAIIHDYPGIFPKEKRNENSESKGSSWAELLRDVAGTHLYGNYDETAYYNLHTILTNVEDDEKRRKKLT